MKTRIITSAVIAAMLGMSGGAFAQEWNHDRDRNGNPRYEQRDGDRRGEYRDHRDRREYRDNRWDNNRWDNRMGNRGGYYEGQRYYNAREWHRGDRLPDEWRNRQYVVNDWRYHHLNAPPRGYQWVQVGGDYVLVAIATGIIANLILSQ